MASWDYFVGFERAPKDLDKFLDSQGYARIPGGPDSPERFFESKEGELVELIYFPKIGKTEEREVPNWRKSGCHVTSELMVSTKEPSAQVEAERIACALVNEYDSVCFDPNDDIEEDAYLRAKDLKHNR